MPFHVPPSPIKYYNFYYYLHGYKNGYGLLLVVGIPDTFFGIK